MKITNYKKIIYSFIFILVIIYFIFLFSSNSHVKNDYQSTPLVLKDSVKIYHELVNDAELNICDNNYLIALNKYYEAFKFIKSPFPRDIYHVILLNTYLFKYKDALKYSRNLVKLGLKLEFFNQIPLNNLKSDSIEWNAFLNDYDSLHNNYMENINLDLKDQIIKLHMMDQKNFCNRDPETGLLPFVLAQDTVFDKCYDILKKFGYPSHDLIGLNIENDTNIINSPEIVIFRHYFQENYNNINEISSLLLKEVFRGKLKPIYFMTWDEFKYEPYPHYGTNILFKTVNGYYTKNFELNIKEINQFDSNRKNILMYSYKDDLKNFNNILFTPVNKN